MLEDALERSLSLAAGMDTRGYGRSAGAPPAERRLTGGLMLLGVCGIAVGVYAGLDHTAPRLLATPMLVLGVVAAVAGLVLAGRRVGRTRYRPDPWRWPELAVMLSGVATALVGLVGQRAPARGRLPGRVVVPAGHAGGAGRRAARAGRGRGRSRAAGGGRDDACWSCATSRSATTTRRCSPTSSLSVEEGELVLVTGPTGSGKSTLLGVVTGLVPRFSGGTLRGDVLLDGVSVLDAPPRERAHAIGYVGQDPLAGFVTDTVEEELAYGMEQLGLPAETMRRRVEETLDLLGIADLRDRDLRTLSGGQQQRVAIGSVLTMHPRLLVLDEPTSALDPTAAEDVLATITRLVHDLGVSVLLAEHRLERVVPFADRICLVTGDGSLVVGEPASVLATSPVVPPLVELGRAAGLVPAAAHREGREAAGRLARAAATARSTRRRPRHAGRGRLRAHRRARPDRGGARGVADALARAGHRADGPQRLGQVVAAVGAAGERAAPVGHGPVVGDASTRSPSSRRSGGLWWGCCRSRRPTCSTSRPSTRSARRAGPTPARCSTRWRPASPVTSTRATCPRGNGWRWPCRWCWPAGPPVVLLDEPTRGLDYRAKRVLAEALRSLAAEGRTVLVSTHDVEFTALAADEVVVLAEGEVVSSGPVRRVVAESPAFAPQVTKVLGPPWLRVDEVVAALGAASMNAVAVPVSRRSAVILAVASLGGLMMLVWPLLLRVQPTDRVDPPFLFLALLPVVIAVMLAELSNGGLDTRVLAVLGVLSAVIAILRGLSRRHRRRSSWSSSCWCWPAGSSAPGFGFVLGVTSLFASALMTAGVGPWLPFQMLVSAWVGMGAGLLPRRVTGRWEIAMLAAYGVVAAYLYGLLMNLSGWPFLLGIVVPGHEQTALSFDPSAAAAGEPAPLRRLHADHLDRLLRHRPRDHQRHRDRASSAPPC